MSRVFLKNNMAVEEKEPKPLTPVVVETVKVTDQRVESIFVLVFLLQETPKGRSTRGFTLVLYG